MAPLIEVTNDYLKELDSSKYTRRKDLEEKFGVPQEKEVTFENTIFNGNEIFYNNKKCKVVLDLEYIKHYGKYKIFLEPLDGGSGGGFFLLDNEQARDWYVLYQNGKK